MKVVLLVLGTILGLLALVALAIAGTGIWADKTQRDADGYFVTGTHAYVSNGYAVTRKSVDVNNVPDSIAKLARVRIHARGQDGVPVFVGVAPRERVAAYLTGVPHTEVRDFDLDPWKATSDVIGGARKPSPPAQQHFWVASATGPAPTLAWKVKKGDWSFVVMNANASRGVATTASLGANIRYLGWLWVGFLVTGVVLLAAAVTLIVVGIRGLSGRRALEPRPKEADTVDVPAGSYPATLSARLDEPLSRWKWIVKWILAIPHYIVLIFLVIAFIVMTIVAWFAILFNGRYPRGIFDFNVGVLRWAWRVQAYTFGTLSTDRYPPFSLERESDYPAVLDVAYPAQLSRGLIFVKLLLALPHLIIVGILAGGGTYFIETNGWHVGGPWSGLIGLLALIAGFALLFTERYPRGLFDLTVGLNRWLLRVIAYVALMTDEYPPFRLDQGGEEPAAPEAAPATAI